ncbi:hypothetical protein BD413DRAFT_503611 [Trametes elegans]|nr:hypothetical protein BD413DRAFT_503611 [Trametes elegans]
MLCIVHPIYTFISLTLICAVDQSYNQRSLGGGKRAEGGAIEHECMSRTWTMIRGGCDTASKYLACKNGERGRKTRSGREEDEQQTRVFNGDGAVGASACAAETADECIKVGNWVRSARRQTLGGRRAEERGPHTTVKQRRMGEEKSRRRPQKRDETGRKRGCRVCLRTGCSM